VTQGRQIFRFDTFGDEAFWGGMLKLHQAIEGAGHAGAGPGLSPLDSLALGLKVDVDALPGERSRWPYRIFQFLRNTSVDRTSMCVLPLHG
jgi:hypothetical protein